jgi:hypothetical protein
LRAALYLAFAFSGVIAAQTSEAPAQPLSALEKDFQDSLANATLDGQFAMDGSSEVAADKYNIDRVVKTSGDNWTFYVKISRQGQDFTLPLPLQIKWAGDTPVITLTNQTLPMMGTYTARVVVYKDHYAGTWNGGTRGGKVFGRVVRQTPPPAN